MGRLENGTLAVAALAVAVAVWLRIHNALHYPADWGYDASYNWQYLLALTRSWQLPPPDAGWSTGDPPLYFYLGGAALRGLGLRTAWLPLLNTALGLGLVAVAVVWVRRMAPADPMQALLAGGLLLFLPAHIHMSAMVNEEMLAALLTALCLLALGGDGAPRAPLRAGVAGGLAALAKLSGWLAVGSAAFAHALAGWRRGLPRAGLSAAGVVLGAALVVAGWFYARSALLLGGLQPFGLPAHARMFDMPPGERSLLDYVYVPATTFSDPQLLNPDLLHSVWGSTYASVWFDAHGYFLPSWVEAGGMDAVRQLGGLTLLLALLPSAAFLVGLVTAARRRRDADLAPLLLTALTLAGFAAYAWRNPWFAVLKGTSLLGLSLPYASYTSETLLRWARRHPALTWGIALWLATLAACVVASGTFDGLFPRSEVPGLPWEKMEHP